MSAFRADLLILLINFISASTYLVTKLCVAPGEDSIPPVTFIALRFTVAAIAVLVFYPRRVRRISRDGLIFGSILGFMCIGGIIFLTLGLQSLQSGMAAFLISFCSVLIPIFDRIFYRQPIGLAVIAGIGLAIAGVYMLSGAEGAILTPATGVMLVATIFFAIHTILNGRYARRTNVLDIGIVQIIAGAVIAGSLAFVFEAPVFPQTAGMLVALIYLGVAATAIRFIFQVYVQSFTTPTRAGVMFMCEPILASFYGWIFAKEMLNPVQIFGCSLILAGTMVAQLGAWLHGRRTRQETVS